MFKCPNCSTRLDETKEYECGSGDAVAGHPVLSCPKCDSDVEWTHIEGNASVQYDFTHQIFRTSEGLPITPIRFRGGMIEEDDFACPMCGGPSELTDVSAYYEYHECWDFGHKFKVN